MKSLSLVILALAALPTFAATPVENTPGLDMAREGDLAAQTLEHARKVLPQLPCGQESLDGNGKEVSEIVVTKTGSSSLVDRFNRNTVYSATYLVTKFCYSGSTQAGAYRQMVDAVIVGAERDTPADGKNAVTTFSVIKSVDVSALVEE